MKNERSSEINTKFALRLRPDPGVILKQIIVSGFTLSAPLLASVESIFVKDYPVLRGKLAKNLFVCDVSDEKILPEALAPMFLIPLNKYEQFEWGRWNSAAYQESINPQDELIFIPRKPLNKLTRPGSPGQCQKLFSTVKYSVFECEPRPQSLPEHKVHFDQKNNVLSSAFYRYQFDPKNQMLFRSIEVDQSGSTTLVAKNSDLLLRGDLKKFFTLNFDANDIKSVLKNHTSQPLGFFGSLGFYLQVAFFKISLDLTTDIRFFNHSAEIPMVLSFPASPRKHLNAGSGIFYSYELGSSVTLKGKSMPTARETASTVKKAYCRADSVCEFSLDYDVLSPSNVLTRAQMSFVFAEDMVAAGAYPVYSSDAVDFLSLLRWPVPSWYRKSTRHGIFIDISSLSEGEHQWQFKLNIEPGHTTN